MARVPTVSTVTNPKRKGYDIALDELLFRAAIGPGREMTISTAEFPQQELNLAQNPEDITTNIGQIFSRNDFSGGQGLDTAHKRNNTPKDGTRFYDSAGVDVFNTTDTSYSVTLLNKMVVEADFDLSSTNNYVVQTTNNKIYVTDGTTVYETSNHGDSWTTYNSGTNGATHAFTGMTSVGNDVYLTTANTTTASQLIKFDGSSWSTLTTAQSSAGGLNGIWYAKGQLIITGDDGDVKRVWGVVPHAKTWSSSDLQDAQAILTFESAYAVSQVADAGAVVLVGATNGNIYSLKDVSGTLTLKGQTNIPFEEVHCIAATEGLVFIGTTEGGFRALGRFYTAQLVVADDLHVLANRQLIKEWNTAQDNVPKHMFVTRDSVYCGIQEGASETNLWRYYLPTGGFARSYKMADRGHVTGITQANGKFLVAVAGADVYLEGTNKVISGYIILPNADFFTSEDKQWVGLELEHDELGNGKTISAFVSTIYDTIDNPNSTAWELIGQSVTGTGNVEYQLNRNARYINTKIVIEPNVSFTESPEFRAVSVRALPRPELVVVTIPINLSDQIERPNRKAFTVDNLGEVIYQTLKQKEGDSVTLQLYEPSEIIRGVVEFVQYPISERSEQGSVTQFCLLRVRGVRAEDTATIVTRLLGVGQLGVAGLG